MSERRTRITRVVLWSCVLVLTAAVAGFAAANVQGAGNGKAVLRFGGPGLTAALSGNLSLSGTWVEGSEKVSFVAQGTAYGSGEWSLATLAGASRVTFRACGTAAQTESIVVCGAFCASGGAQRFALGAVDFIAQFVLVVHRASGDFAYAGSAAGRLVGGFVVPEIPYTMQANGSVSLSLAGEPIASPLAGLDWTATPWDAATWPDEVSRRLLGSLGWTPPPTQVTHPGR